MDTHQLLMHQFTVRHMVKGGKIINHIITHHSNFNPDMHKHVHSEATYRLLVEQFTVQQVGKGGKIINQNI